MSVSACSVGLDLSGPRAAEAHRMSSPPPTDASSNNDMTNPIEEFQDDRPQQDQLVESSARASANTDSRIDEGGSDEFVDDRPDVCNSTEDTGKQASLVPEVIEDETDRTGSQPTEDPEYLDGGTQESALDALADGSWNPSTISRAFDVTGNVANSIMEMGSDASHVLKVEDNTGDLTEWPGIGDASASSIRSTIPLLKSRGITRYGLPLSDDDDQATEHTGGDISLDDDLQESYGRHDRIAPETGELARWENSDGHALWVTYDTTVPEHRAYSVESDWGAVKLDIGPDEVDGWVANLADRADTMVDDDSSGGRDEWADAVEYLREFYGDTYDDRITLSTDLMDHGTEEGLDVPQSVGGEAVTQPLIRYQDIPPEDAWTQIMNSVGQREADQIRELLVSFAAAERETGADVDEDADDLEGVESVTEQTVMEGIVGSLDVPEPWMIVDAHEDAEQEPSILVEHPDGYLAEIWLRGEDVSSGVGKWDVEYVDPVGTRRDGSGQFHESAQDALDELVPHIKEVRAEERDRAEQQAEQEDIDWPETIGRFRLREQTVSDTHAEYRTDYLAGYGILGTKRRERSEGIRFYDDTRKYHFMDETYARKKTAIETAEEKLTDLTETLDEREDAVIEQNDIPDHVLPHRYRGDLDDQDSGSDDVPDSKPRQMGVSPDDTDQLTVDIRFATEGISASVYAISETPNRTDLLEEAWYTWTEVDELTTDTESHIIFEIPVQHSQNENEDAAD
ncbi:hypothetical protein [Haloglomus irregulare]|nr:hypothetical protein [Haloglomus irregulare]